MFERVPLDEVADLAMGETIIAEDCDGRGLPIYSAATNDAPWNHSTRFIRKLKKGTIVVGARGSIGFPRMPADDLFGATQTTITVVARGGSVVPRFLFHVLRGIDFKTLTSQQAIPMLTVAEFSGVSLPRPPIEEQGKVVEILDTLDTTIRQTEAIIEKLNQVKQGLLHDLLTRGIDANGELRPPQSQAPHLYKESPLGWIPREWDVTTLANMLSVRLGFAFRSEDYVERGLLNFRVANIGRGESAIGDAAYLPESFWDAFPRQQFTGGEIVIVMVGATTGKLGRVPKALCPALQNQNMWNLVPLPGLNREFLWHLMPGAVSRHLALAQGSARDFLTQSAFLRTDCVRPDEMEQECIVARIDAIDADILVNRSLAGKLRALKSGLMDDLLTGRVRVTPLLA